MKRLVWILPALLAGMIAKGQDVYAPYTPRCGPRSEALGGQSVFQVADKMPQFPGGKEAITQFILSHLQYSQAEKPQKPIGVRFVVDTTGQVVNACIMIPDTAQPTPMELEVLRVVQLLPNWTPGQQGRRKVPVKYSHIIKFNSKEK